MPKAFKITRRDREILTATLPNVILPLVRRRVITARSLDDPKALWGLLVKNVRTATKEMQWGVAIEESFLERSIEFWGNGEQLMAVVLYATAVEQYLNQMYQLILAAQGWKKHHATCMLRAKGQSDNR